MVEEEEGNKIVEEEEEKEEEEEERNKICVAVVVALTPKSRSGTASGWSRIGITRTGRRFWNGSM